MESSSGLVPRTPVSPSRSAVFCSAYNPEHQVPVCDCIIELDDLDENDRNLRLNDPCPAGCPHTWNQHRSPSKILRLTPWLHEKKFPHEYRTASTSPLTTPTRALQTTSEPRPEIPPQPIFQQLARTEESSEVELRARLPAAAQREVISPPLLTNVDPAIELPSFMRAIGRTSRNFPERLLDSIIWNDEQTTLLLPAQSAIPESKRKSLYKAGIRIWGEVLRSFRAGNTTRLFQLGDLFSIGEDAYEQWVAQKPGHHLLSGGLESTSLFQASPGGTSFNREDWFAVLSNDTAGMTATSQSSYNAMVFALVAKTGRHVWIAGAFEGKVQDPERQLRPFMVAGVTSMIRSAFQELTNFDELYYIYESNNVRSGAVLSIAGDIARNVNCQLKVFSNPDTSSSSPRLGRHTTASTKNLGFYGLRWLVANQRLTIRLPADIKDPTDPLVRLRGLMRDHKLTSTSTHTPDLLMAVVVLLEGCIRAQQDQTTPGQVWISEHDAVQVGVTERADSVTDVSELSEVSEEPQASEHGEPEEIQTEPQVSQAEAPITPKKTSPAKVLRKKMSTLGKSAMQSLGLSPPRGGATTGSSRSAQQPQSGGG